MAAEDALDMAWVLDAERRSVEQIIEGEQVHGVQVAALSQMQLQAMERVDAQEKELWRLCALLLEHQALLNFLLEMPCQETTQAPPKHLNQLRCEAIGICPVQLTSKEGYLQKLIKSLT